MVNTFSRYAWARATCAGKGEADRGCGEGEHPQVPEAAITTDHGDRDRGRHPSGQVQLAGGRVTLVSKSAPFVSLHEAPTAAAVSVTL